jgi:class 3 adenylate cyclase
MQENREKRMNSSPALQMLSKVRVVVEKTRPLITLVFTDVVGSSATKRVDVLGADTHSRDRQYISLIHVKYLRLVRSAVREHNGKEVMTIGDSFFLTFENPDDALECSMAIQRTLYTQPIYTPHGPLQLRIGIHVGSPEYFERSWHGTDVDIAARIEGIGSPGQIVLTDAARNAMSGDLGIGLRRLGTFALKGVGQLKLWCVNEGTRKLRKLAIPSLEQKRRNRIVACALLALSVVGLAAGETWMWRQSPFDVVPDRVAEHVIMDSLENRTPEAIFNSTLADRFTFRTE